MRTSVPDILAAGDAVETAHLLTGEPVLSMLAGPANREGRIAAEAICRHQSAYRGSQGTAIVKVFEMAAGGTGLTEAQLRERGSSTARCTPTRTTTPRITRAARPCSSRCFLPHRMGSCWAHKCWAGTAWTSGSTCSPSPCAAGMTVYDLEHVELAYAPPYGSAKDPVNMIGFQASNLLKGDIDLWYAEDYPECAERTTILDVRTVAEYEYWHIPEAINIPYTELRDRLGEVPKDRPVYSYCRSGFRSYIAYCILRQHDFTDTAFLSGGLITFHGFHRTPLEVGQGGFPIVAHAEDQMATRPGALEHV